MNCQIALVSLQNISSPALYAHSLRIFDTFFALIFGTAKNMAVLECVEFSETSTLAANLISVLQTVKKVKHSGILS